MVLDLLPLQLHIPTYHGFIRPLVNDEETATGVETVNHGDKRRFPTSARPIQIFASLFVKPTRHANESQRCKADAATVATFSRLGYFSETNSKERV